MIGLLLCYLFHGGPTTGVCCASGSRAQWTDAVRIYNHVPMLLSPAELVAVRALILNP